MKVIADLCVVPVGVGVSVSAHVAACQRVLQEAGLTTQLHAYGTNIEGEWDTVFAADSLCQALPRGGPRDGRAADFDQPEDRHPDRPHTDHGRQSVERCPQDGRAGRLKPRLSPSA